MKQVINFMNATVFDVEADNLLDEATKIHVLSFEMAGGRKDSIAGTDVARLRSFFLWHRDNGVPLVAHNGICYDIPLVEKLLGLDLSGLILIDTLALSWYMNTKRSAHGLDTFFEDYGIKKPKIDDWENLSYEEYKYRCEEDVKINKALWTDLLERLWAMYSIAQKYIDMELVGGSRFEGETLYIDKYINGTVEDAVSRILTFLMFKMDTVRLREKTRWKVDVESLRVLHDELEETILTAKANLEAVMPQVPKYMVAKRPKNLTKKDGSLSVAGERWQTLMTQHNTKEVDEYGNRLAIGVDMENIKKLKKYEEPNANSPGQIKDFLFKHGWKPKTFKFVVDKEAKNAWAASGFKKELKPESRQVPQISVDGEGGKELCDSVLELAEKVPEIMNYSKYTLIKHRLDMVKGFLENVSEDGYLRASVGGFTNTLRDQHRGLVNLPGVDKPYGDRIRGALTCLEEEILLGTDLSSLEDRVKHHFMLPIDPDYVATMMAEDYDPHLQMALTAGMISQQDIDDFKAGVKNEHVKAARKKGKCTNYASVYNAGPETIARSAEVGVDEGKKLHTAYWKLNWAVKQIAEEQVVFDFEYKIPATGDGMNQRWLINPINGFCYECRKDSDRFSTLCQGTGSFFFDMWVDTTLTKMEENGKYKRLSGNFHDEMAFPCLIEEQEEFDKMVESSIEDVNQQFGLRRSLGCDVQFGQNYAQIH